MRKSVLTGIFACTLVFIGGSAKAETLPQEPTITNSEKTVAELLSVGPNTALTEIAEAVKLDQPVVNTPEVLVMTHIVAKSETLSDIAKLYSVDWQRIFDKNINLSNPDVIDVGVVLIIPNPDEVIEPRALPIPAPVFTMPTEKKVAPAQVVVARETSTGNGYVAGYCTWYVKSRRPDLPNNLGNASSWIHNASKQGLATGSTPVVGAVGQRNNHVVYVEAINGDGTITISDMNHQALYEITTRTVNASDFRYIY